MKKLYQKALLIFFLSAILSAVATPIVAQVYWVHYRVFHDSLENCIRDSFEKGIGAGSVITVMQLLPSGKTIKGGVNQNGLFGTGFHAEPGDTLLRAYILGTSSLRAGCETYYEFPIAPDTSLADTSFTFRLDFPIHVGQCPQMGVSIAGDPPRPCFDRVYDIQAYNQGLDVAHDVYVDVKLDSNLIFQSSSIPGTELPGHQWRFQLGDFQGLATNQFTITYQLNCEVPLGQIICSEAAVYPDTVCVSGNGWGGASIIASADCIGDSVVVKLRNTKNIPSSSGLNYIIAEDMIMYRQDMYELGPLDSIEWSMPGNGSTWHISAEQEPGYPYHIYTNATIEGCGTNQSGGNSTGIFLNYPFSSGQVNRGEDCQEAVSSYDPNDKLGFPTGFGPSHLIRVGDEIKYQIRFQNTGNDTAYTITVREKLPEGLDPKTIVPGVSSYPYAFSMDQNGEMVFIFSEINLPDSISDPIGSNGFLTYKARPYADLPGGSIISGSASIFFDFNPAIVTNSCFHTIGDDFIKVEVNTPFKNALKLSVFPNPGNDYINFIWDQHQHQVWQVNLYDVLGKRVKTIDPNGNAAIVACAELPAGLYYFQVKVDGQAAANGKVIVK